MRLLMATNNVIAEFKPEIFSKRTVACFLTFVTSLGNRDKRRYRRRLRLLGPLYSTLTWLAYVLFIQGLTCR